MGRRLGVDLSALFAPLIAAFITSLHPNPFSAASVALEAAIRITVSMVPSVGVITDS